MGMGGVRVKKIVILTDPWTPSQDRKIFFSVKENLIVIGKQFTVIWQWVAHEGTQKLQKKMWWGLVSLSVGVCVILRDW